MVNNSCKFFECIQTLESSIDAIKSLTISPEGQIIFSGSNTHPLKVWDFLKQQVRQTTEKDYDTDNYEFVVLSPDGPKLVICSYNSIYEPKVTIWDWHTEEEICSFEIDTFCLTYEWDHEHHYRPYKFSVTLCPSGKAIVISYDYQNEYGGSVCSVSQVVSLATGFSFRLNGDSNGICWAISQDERTFVSVTNNNTIKVWKENYNDTDWVKEKYGYGSLSHGDRVCTDAVMADLDFNTVEVYRILEEHSANITSLALDGYYEILVSGGADSNIKVWNLQTEEIIQTLQGHSAAVTCLDISEDGETLVSGSDDNTIVVWDFDLQNEQVIYTLKGHSSGVKAVAISADGQTIFSHDDNTIKVWGVRSAKSEV